MKNKDKVIAELKKYALDNIERLSNDPVVGAKFKLYAVEGPDFSERLGASLNIIQWEKDYLGVEPIPAYNEYLELRDEIYNLEESVNELSIQANPLMVVYGELDVMISDDKSLESVLLDVKKSEIDLAYKVIRPSFESEFVDKTYNQVKGVSEKLLRRTDEIEGVKINTFGRGVHEAMLDLTSKNSLVMPKMEVVEHDGEFVVKTNFSDITALNLLESTITYHVDVSDKTALAHLNKNRLVALDEIKVVGFMAVMDSEALIKGKEFLDFHTTPKLAKIDALIEKGKELGLIESEAPTKKKQRSEER